MEHLFRYLGSLDDTPKEIFKFEHPVRVFYLHFGGYIGKTPAGEGGFPCIFYIGDIETATNGSSIIHVCKALNYELAGTYYIAVNEEVSMHGYKTKQLYISLWNDDAERVNCFVSYKRE